MWDMHPKDITAPESFSGQKLYCDDNSGGCEPPEEDIDESGD